MGRCHQHKSKLFKKYQRFTHQLMNQAKKPEFQQIIFIEKNREAIDRLFKKKVITRSIIYIHF
ncbi:MAG TPA: hypothetical protein VF095_09255 [Bacillota bacterium]